MNRKKRKELKKQQVRCPYCGSIANLRSADGIYRENSKNAMLYVCRNYPECSAYVRVHPNTDIPMGSLADKELRSLRKTAHYYFNQLYESGLMSKNDAYQWLANILVTPLSEAHIGYLGEYYCKLVIEESRRFLEQYNKKIKISKFKGNANLKLVRGGVSP